MNQKVRKEQRFAMLNTKTKNHRETSHQKKHNPNTFLLFPCLYSLLTSLLPYSTCTQVNPKFNLVILSDNIYISYFTCST